MAAIVRRSHMAPVSTLATLASPNALSGTTDNTQAYDVTGALRVIVVQMNNGTAGSAGIDVVEISKDGGKTWAPDPNVLPVGQDDATGTVLVGGALNAAGVAPNGAAVFKCGPYEGPTAIRIGRATGTTSGTSWVTGAPGVYCFAIGKTTGALSSLA